MPNSTIMSRWKCFWKNLVEDLKNFLRWEGMELLHLLSLQFKGFTATSVRFATQNVTFKILTCQGQVFTNTTSYLVALSLDVDANVNTIHFFGHHHTSYHLSSMLVLIKLVKGIKLNFEVCQF